jgi:hypothetical protein
MPADEALIAHVPATGTVPKNVVLAKWNQMGVGEKKCRNKLEVMISDGLLHEHRKPRPGTRPEVHISRHEQTLI